MPGRFECWLSTGRRIGRTALLAAALLFGAPGHVPAAGTLPPMTYDTATHLVTLALTAGEGGGYNFDGYAHGALVLKVPTGSMVQVTLQNLASDVPHSAGLSPWADRIKGSGLATAFPGSAPTDFDTGVTSHDPPQRFSFTARAAGRYALACG